MNSQLYLYGVICIISLVGAKSIKVDYYSVATTPSVPTDLPLSRYEQGLEDYDEMQARQGKGMMDDIEYSDHDMKPQMSKDMSEQKAVANDAWAGYYDFIINEGSFKFWAVFQLVTAALLIYSALAAVYYAKFNIQTTDYDYYYDFFGRSDSGSSEFNGNWFGVNASTFQRILDAISSKKYS